MTKKSARRKKFAEMTVDEIFSAWVEAATSGLKDGQTFGPDVFGPKSRFVPEYKGSISRCMGDPKSPPFNAADFRKTTRVARDLGRICSIMATAEADAGEKAIVGSDIFERARKLASIHASCPVPVGGGGRWCGA
jgi:hypothetical protein